MEEFRRAICRLEYLEKMLIFFCSPLCSKSFKVVAEIEFNNGTSQFRLKTKPSDEFEYGNTSDWCTKFE